jgi:hypothetical protein
LPVVVRLRAVVWKRLPVALALASAATVLVAGGWQAFALALAALVVTSWMAWRAPSLAQARATVALAALVLLIELVGFPIAIRSEKEIILFGGGHPLAAVVASLALVAAAGVRAAQANAAEESGGTRWP